MPTESELALDLAVVDLEYAVNDLADVYRNQGIDALLPEQDRIWEAWITLANIMGAIRLELKEAA